MRLSLIATTLVIFAAAFLGHPTLAKAACNKTANCSQLWVAGDHIGMPLSFFSQVVPPTDVNQIQIGDTLGSTLPVNIRPSPGDLSKTNGVLLTGSIVTVEDIRRLTIHGKSQIWLRLSVAPRHLKTASVRVAVPPSAKGPSPEASTADTGESSILNSRAKKIISCYNKLAAGSNIVTVSSLKDCSGYWVTQRALMECAIGVDHCPAYVDSIGGKAIALNQLTRDNLSIDSPLTIDAKYLPSLPDAKTITNCKSNSTNQDDFQNCVTAKMADRYKDVFDCSTKFTEGEKLLCLSQLSGNEDFTSLINCLGAGKPSPDKIAECTSRKEIASRVDELRDCVASASGGDKARACIWRALPKEDRALASCLDRPDAGADPSSCLDLVSPDVEKAHAIQRCFANEANPEDLSRCLGGRLGGDAAKVAGCINTSDVKATTICLLGDTPQLRALGSAEKCISQGRDAASVIANCTDGLMDEKTRQSVACLAKAGTDRAALASCAAGAVLNPDAARLVGCASDSSGPTAFAICAAGPYMNEEWRIAAECAVETGGNPVGFAGCTAGQLTIRELTKCFNGQIGKDCFGPNNTIIVGYRNAFHDLTQGPGKNNDIVKALEAIGQLTGGPNSVVNNPKQILPGPGSVFNQPGQIFGGDGSVFHDPGQITRGWHW
ncbi:hypothetical protein [Labrys sp. ZIDIC5]|uniref:hypothetical protein n=1 Tax=Labrys sedimenti TaxID=3106036 RepID=UPI002ACA300F|nr:hypothetical protein [Labrys sp. ZIDIC5]MDZ5448257.1 hypothetical protein [Labrys sp. ZIDIC5]